MTTEPIDSTELLKTYDERRAVIDDHVGEFLPADAAGELADASRHLFEAGGKRLRPVTALLATEAVAERGFDALDYRAVPDAEGNDVDVLQAAFALEVIHTFTLVHDDIMDEDDLRRGAPAVHEAYGEDVGILAGDYLYAVAYDLLLTCGATPERVRRAVQLATDTMLDLCRGQARDVGFEGRDDVTPDEYLEMVRGKTAALYGASAALPAIVLGADETHVTALKEFGENVGMAFQIFDDVLDLMGDEETLGKNWGSDLVEEKQTLITLHARQNGLDADAIFPGDDPSTGAIAEAVERIKGAGSIRYAQTEAEAYIEQGKRCLTVLPDSEARAYLLALADYLIERSH